MEKGKKIHVNLIYYFAVYNCIDIKLDSFVWLLSSRLKIDFH